MKITTVKELIPIARLHRMVLCHGCFDYLHPGHLYHFRQAKEYGNRLVVSVTTDAWVNKGPGRPFVPDRLRAELLAELEIVDYVVLTPGESAAELIRTLRPAIFAKGHDYADMCDPRLSDEAEALASYDGEMVFTGTSIRFSSTALGSA